LGLEDFFSFLGHFFLSFFIQFFQFFVLLPGFLPLVSTWLVLCSFSYNGFPFLRPSVIIFLVVIVGPIFPFDSSGSFDLGGLVF